MRPRQNPGGFWNEENTKTTERSVLLEQLFGLIERYRGAFRQERTYRRTKGMIIGELLRFARHTVTQSILALGIKDGDCSAWYWLFSKERFDEAVLNACLLHETLEHVPENEPYVTAMDGTSFHRSSLKMPGTSWLRDGRFSAFRPGLQRAQRFLHGAWLTPLEEGYSWAVPLRLLPAFPLKPIPSEHPAIREWEAGLAFLHWVRTKLDSHGRTQQLILVLADGAFDVLDLWRGLPKRTILITYTARNRRLYWLLKPDPHPAPGRIARYSECVPHPCDWLHAGLRNWPKSPIQVRGKTRTMRFQVLGPFVRDGLPEMPLFLIVIKGMHRLVGKQKNHYKHKSPSFQLAMIRLPR